MPRIYLIAARKRAELSQSRLAGKMGVDHKSVSLWETGAVEPQSSQKEAIRRVLKNNDPHLFDVVSSRLQDLVICRPSVI